MDTTYATLLADWKRASAQTRCAQAALNEQFEAHFKREGPPPNPRDIERLLRLRELEAGKLQALLEHVAAAARGPSKPRGSTAHRG